MTFEASTLTGMTLAEASNRLNAPFPADQHEQHGFHKFWYLKEEAINNRMNEVFGTIGWDKLITKTEYIPSGLPVVAENGYPAVFLDQFPGEIESDNGKYYSVWTDDNGVRQGTPLSVIYDIPCVLQYGAIITRAIVNGQIVESRRESVGADVLVSLGKEFNAKLHNTYKSADTDMLKRCARMFGVGLYLTQISTLNKADKAAVESEKGLGDWIRKYYGPTSVMEAKKMIVERLASTIDAAEIGKRVKDLALSDEQLLYRFEESLALIKNKAA